MQPIHWRKNNASGTDSYSSSIRRNLFIQQLGAWPTTTAYCQTSKNPSVPTLLCSSSDRQRAESSRTGPRCRQIRGETDRLDSGEDGGRSGGGDGVLTTMTLKRLASLGGSDDPMATAGAARRGEARRREP